MKFRPKGTLALFVVFDDHWRANHLDIETDHNQHQPAGLYQLKSCRKLLLVGVAAFIVVAIIIVARY
jgi:hypothetical protein